MSRREGVRGSIRGGCIWWGGGRYARGGIPLEGQQQLSTAARAAGVQKSSKGLLIAALSPRDAGHGAAGLGGLAGVARLGGVSCPDGGAVLACLELCRTINPTGQPQSCLIPKTLTAAIRTHPRIPIRRCPS